MCGQCLYGYENDTIRWPNVKSIQKIMYLDEKLSTDTDRVRGGKLVVTREKEKDKTQPEGTRR